MRTLENGLWLLFGFLIAQISFGQTDITVTNTEKLPPVLNYVPENEVMALIEAEFALAEIGRRIPTNGRKADAIFRRLNKNHEELLASGDSEDLTDLKKAFQQGLAVYVYYMSTDFLGTHSAKLNRLREMNYKVGEWVYLREAEIKEKNRLRILQLAMGLGQPAYLSDSITKIIDLQRDAAPKFNKAIKLLLFYNLQSSPSTAGSADQILAEIGDSLNERQKVLVELIRADASLGTRGIGVDAGEGSGPKVDELLQISQQAQTVTEKGIRWRINGTILNLWLANAQNPDWRSAPLVEVQEKRKDVVTPLRERIVIEDIAAGDLRKGIKVYSQLSKAFRGKSISIQLDNRFLLLVKDFVASNGAIEFENKVLNDLVQKYTKPNKRFRKLSKKALYVFFLEYRRFQQALLEKALIDSSTPKFRNRVLAISSKFIKDYNHKRSEILAIKQLVAQLFQKQSRHKEAVREYLDLAKDEPLKYYNAAADSQKILAGWPVAAPWGKLPAGSRSERATLIAIFEAKIRTQKKLNQPRNWSDLAHLGLLYVATGQMSKAETLWAPEIGTAQPNINVNGASGILLGNYFKQKRWTDFINLARVTNQRKILATLQQQVLDVPKFYKSALLNRSTQSQAAGKWDDAILDHEEIIDRYRKDTKRPQYLLEVSRMYTKIDKIKKAIGSINQLVREYPNSQQAKTALLEGGRLAKNTSKKDILLASSDFYRIYVESFPADKFIPLARYERANILIKLKQFPLASQYLREHALDKRVKPVERVKAALLHISLEDQYGEGNRAVASLVPVLGLAKPSFGEDIYLTAHVILARVATEKVSLQEMAKEERILAPHIKKRADIADVLGYLRITAANHYEYEIPFPSQAFGIDGFKPAIAAILKSYNAVKRGYLNVCLPRENRYCEAAYGRLKQYAQDAADALNA